MRKRNEDKGLKHRRKHGDFNCFMFAVTKLHLEGGYLVLRCTSNPKKRWRTLHCMHVGEEGLQHFSPGAPLGHPAKALLGFDGVIWDREMSDAPPVPIGGLILSSLLAFLGMILWTLRFKTLERKL